MSAPTLDDLHALASKVQVTVNAEELRARVRRTMEQSKARTAASSPPAVKNGSAAATAIDSSVSTRKEDERPSPLLPAAKAKELINQELLSMPSLEPMTPAKMVSPKKPSPPPPPVDENNDEDAMDLDEPEPIRPIPHLPLLPAGASEKEEGEADEEEEEEGSSEGDDSLSSSSSAGSDAYERLEGEDEPKDSVLDLEVEKSGDDGHEEEVLAKDPVAAELDERFIAPEGSVHEEEEKEEEDGQKKPKRRRRREPLPHVRDLDKEADRLEAMALAYRKKSSDPKGLRAFVGSKAGPLKEALRAIHGAEVDLDAIERDEVLSISGDEDEKVADEEPPGPDAMDLDEPTPLPPDPPAAEANAQMTLPLEPLEDGSDDIEKREQQQQQLDEEEADAVLANRATSAKEEADEDQGEQEEEHAASAIKLPLEERLRATIDRGAKVEELSAKILTHLSRTDVMQMPIMQDTTPEDIAQNVRAFMAAFLAGPVSPDSDTPAGETLTKLQARYFDKLRRTPLHTFYSNVARAVANPDLPPEAKARLHLLPALGLAHCAIIENRLKAPSPSQLVCALTGHPIPEGTVYTLLMMQLQDETIYWPLLPTICADLSGFYQAKATPVTTTSTAEGVAAAKKKKTAPTASSPPPSPSKKSPLAVPTIVTAPVTPRTVGGGGSGEKAPPPVAKKERRPVAPPASAVPPPVRRELDFTAIADYDADDVPLPNLDSPELHAPPIPTSQAPLLEMLRNRRFHLVLRNVDALVGLFDKVAEAHTRKKFGIIGWSLSEADKVRTKSSRVEFFYPDGRPYLFNKHQNADAAWLHKAVADLVHAFFELRSGPAPADETLTKIAVNGGRLGAKLNFPLYLLSEQLESDAYLAFVKHTRQQFDWQLLSTLIEFTFQHSEIASGRAQHEWMQQPSQAQIEATEVYRLAMHTVAEGARYSALEDREFIVQLFPGVKPTIEGRPLGVAPARCRFYPRLIARLLIEATTFTS